ncbi:hypothetical protein, partial [Bacteroides ovatus]
RLYYLFRECLLILCTINIPLLVGCSDDNEMGIINPSQKNIIRLSIPDAELVQVRSVANESECKISGIQVFVYNDSHTSSPVYYQEGTTDSSFLFGNGTASPTVTLKEYIPADKERIYVVCNLTNRSSVSGTGNFLVDETVSEEQLRNYASQGLIKGISNLKDEGQSIPMYGWMEWNENATSNVCLLTRCLAKITVDAAADLFTGKQVYWEWKNLNYSDFVLDSEYRGIYQGAINDAGTSGKYDLLSATTPVDGSIGLLTAYYPLEYKHSVYALGNGVDEKKFTQDRSMLLLTVLNPDGSNKEYYRLDFWDKETGKYLDIVRNHAYRFNITKLKSKGYTSAQEAIQNPGSNIEYMITVSDKWTQGFNSNGQYLVNTDRKEIKLLQGSITDPVIMLKIELQADDAGNVNLDNVTTRKVRLLGKDKELVSRFFIQTFYSTDNEHLIPIDNGIVMDAIPSVPSMGLNITGNECELPLDNKYWIYATVVDGATLMPREGFLEITIGNIVKYIPFSIIPHTEAIPVDEDGPANCFITPVTYGVYSFDATVIGNGADGIVAETKTQDGDYEEWHFKNAYGEDISVSKNVGITPKSAKLIWQDQENLISQVSFDITINRVAFLSNGAGNGVIAVYDKSDPNAEDANVLWSWHIWCTEKPDIIELGLPTNGETYSGINYKIMDRDLGATTTIPDELTTCGLGYQWGRKDPFIGMASLGNNNNAPMYDVRGNKLDFKKIDKTVYIGTIEYSIKHPDTFILGGANNSSYDWLYYTMPLGNQYLWGNPNSKYDMVDIKSLKTIYDPCPAGYKVPLQDIYGVFLKNPVIQHSEELGIPILSAWIDLDDFYSPKPTTHGMYLYYGENGVRSVYFISNSVRSGRTDSHPGELKPFHYAGYTSGTMLSHQNSGMNTIISLSFGIQHRVSLNYGFGGENSLSPDRAAAGSIRCVRDE